MLYSRHALRGFTLVELSVVVVVIALLVGTILVGQTMIRGSELQGIITDYTKYQTAVEDFRKQYKALPGDMIDATDYWGISTACAGASTTGTCKGDGDALIDPAAIAGGAGENYQVWVQLKLAGRITGTYSGAAGSGGASHSVGGTNVPKGIIKTSAWEVNYLSPTYGGDATTYANGNYGNYFRFGATTTSGANTAAILKPDDARKVDDKLDDGRPGTGTIVAGIWDDCTNSATFNVGASDRYLVEAKQPACILYFVNQF